MFPDGKLATPAEVIDFAEGAGFELRDVERLREHYALMLRHWVRQLEARHDASAALTNETTYRVWRLNMPACAYAFATDHTSVMQMLFSKTDEAGRTHLPLTRADLFRGQSTD